MKMIQVELLSKLKSDLRRATTADDKKDCLLLLDTAMQNFKSKYSYWFYYFLKMREERKYYSCTKIVADNVWIFSLNELKGLLRCREKYADNYHMLKINVLDKLSNDFNIAISEHKKTKKRVDSVRIEFIGIRGEDVGDGWKRC